MLRYFFVTAILACVSFSASDTFAQRGGRARAGAAPAEDEKGQSTGKRGRPSDGATQNDDSPTAPSTGRGRGGRPGGTSAAASGSAPNSLFAALDADGNGVITRAEMEDAIQAFARLDENKDGKLSKEEAGATSGAMARRGGGSQGGRGNMQATERLNESGSKASRSKSTPSKSASPFSEK